MQMINWCKCEQIYKRWLLLWSIQMWANKTRMKDAKNDIRDFCVLAFECFFSTYRDVLVLLESNIYSNMTTDVRRPIKKSNPGDFCSPNTVKQNLNLKVLFYLEFSCESWKIRTKVHNKLSSKKGHKYCWVPR